MKNTPIKSLASLISSLVIAFPLQAGGAPNSLIIVVANGPFAGTYRPPPAEIICLHAKAQRVFSAAWKDFSAHEAKAFAEGGIEVSNPDVAGKKHGNISLTFGDPSNHPTVYSLSNAPLDFELTQSGGTIAFDGTVNSSVHIKVTAECRDVTRV